MRAQLINDAFGLSQATEVPADLALKLVGYLCNETDYLPWNVFLSRSKFYTDMLDHTKYGDNIQKYFAKLTNLYYSKFNTWHGNDTSNETWLDRFYLFSFLIIYVLSILFLIQKTNKNQFYSICLFSWSI